MDDVFLCRVICRHVLLHGFIRQHICVHNINKIDMLLYFRADVRFLHVVLGVTPGRVFPCWCTCFQRVIAQIYAWRPAKR
jgi:hypothetical protein